jgi:hypothetical protein
VVHYYKNLTTHYTMSLDEWLDGSHETVDPEVRAYVGSLVNAVCLFHNKVSYALAYAIDVGWRRWCRE